jgi:hypothetical protein
LNPNALVPAPAIHVRTDCGGIMSGRVICWLLMGLGVVWGAVAMFRERFKRRKMLEGRVSLCDDEIYSQFYEQSGLPRSAALHVWHEVASALYVDSGKMRPSDQVIQYKSKVFQLQSDLDHLNDWLCMLSRKSKLNSGKLDTIDDVVRFAVQCELTHGT